MLLIEADGKALFAEHGIPVPDSVLVVAPPVTNLPGTGPWIIKAQVPVGGRGKMGGVLRGVSVSQVNAVGRTIDRHAPEEATRWICAW